MTDSELSPARFGATFRAFMDAVLAAAEPRDQNPLQKRIATHLGADLPELPVIAEEYDPFEHPNLQLALDAYIAAPDRRATLVGIAAQNKRYFEFGLSDLLSIDGEPHGPPTSEGPVDYVNVHLAGGDVLPCVDLGLYFIHDGETPLLALVRVAGDHSPRQKLGLEVVAHQREHAQRFIAEITETMDRLNVYRGHVVSLSAEFGPGRKSLITFHTLPSIGRDGIILPAGLLDRIERQTIVFSEQAERLKAAGRSLKRGLLLYGPPGVGKTLTVEYLTSRMQGRTVILTTGLGMGMLEPAVQLARKLAPAMVVLEDVDLIAEERGMPYGHSGPLLFTLLNEMDGLQDDSDVIFVLTTNRPDILEPALAARPGRIDLAVEYPLPDTEARLRLLHLYARGLVLDNVDLEDIAERIGGATPAYVKELLRKAAVLAAAEAEELVVTQSHLEAALSELDAGSELARRILGLRPQEPDGGFDPQGQGTGPYPSGFPAHQVSTADLTSKG